MKKLRKILSGVLVLLALAGAAIWFADYGGPRAVRWAADGMAGRWGLTLTVASVKGNPLRGFLFSGLRLSLKGQDLASLEQVQVSSGDPLWETFFLKRRPELRFRAAGGAASIQGLWQLLSAFSGQTLLPLPQWLSREDVELRSLSGSIGDRSEFLLDGDLAGVRIGGRLLGRSHRAGWTLDEGLLSLPGGVVALAGPLLPKPDLSVEIHGLSLEDFEDMTSALAVQELKGLVDASLNFSGPLNNPELTGSLALNQASLAGVPLKAEGFLNVKGWVMEARQFTLVLSGVPLSGRVWVNLDHAPLLAELDMKALAPVPAETLKANLPGLPPGLWGQVEQANISVKGPLQSLDGSAYFEAQSLGFGSLEGRNLSLEALFDGQGAALIQGRGFLGEAPMDLDFRISGGIQGLTGRGTLEVKALDLVQIASFVPPGWEPVGGVADLKVELDGALTNPYLEGQIECPRFHYGSWALRNLSGSFVGDSKGLRLDRFRAVFMDSPVKASGALTLEEDPEVALHLSADAVALEALIPSVRGRGQIRADLKGPLLELQAAVELWSPELELDLPELLVQLPARTPAGSVTVLASAAALRAGGSQFQDLRWTMTSQGGRLQLEALQGQFCGGVLTASGPVLPEMELSLELRDGDLARLPQLPALKNLAVQGRLSGKASLRGPLEAPQIQGLWDLRDGQVGGIAVAGRFQASMSRQEVQVQDLEGSLWGAPARLSFSALARPRPRYELALQAQRLPVERVRSALPELPQWISGEVDHLDLTFQGWDLEDCSAKVKLEGSRLFCGTVALEGVLFEGAAAPGGRFALSGSANLAGSPLILSGAVDRTGKTVDLKFNGATANLGRLAELRPELQGFQGTAVAELRITGDLEAPQVSATFSALSAELPYLGAIGNLTLRCQGALDAQGTLRSHVTASNLWLQGLALADLQGALTVQENRWYLRPLGGTLGAGALEASLTLWPQLEGHFRIANFDGADLPRLGLGAAEGPVDLRGTASGTLAAPQITLELEGIPGTEVHLSRPLS